MSEDYRDYAIYEFEVEVGGPRFCHARCSAMRRRASVCARPVSCAKTGIANRTARSGETATPVIDTEACTLPLGQHGHWPETIASPPFPTAAEALAMPHLCLPSRRQQAGISGAFVFAAIATGTVNSRLLRSRSSKAGIRLGTGFSISHRVFPPRCPHLRLRFSQANRHYPLGCFSSQPYSLPLPTTAARSLIWAAR